MANERYRWHRETEHLNYGKTIKVGDAVVDAEGNPGNVTKIVPDGEDSPKGDITVKVSGAKNDKHYNFINWESNLRIVGDA